MKEELMNSMLLYIKITIVKILKFVLEKPVLYCFLFGIKIRTKKKYFEERRKPHLLILQYEFYGGDPKQGKSAEDWNIKGPLVAADLATFDTFYWDSEFKRYLYGDCKLLWRCATVRPDAIVLSSYDVLNYKQASTETIRMIANDLNIPIIAFWWDTCWDGFWEYNQCLLPYITLHVIPDNDEMNSKDRTIIGKYSDRVIYTWIPIDPVEYCNPHWERNIGISFCGRVSGYRANRLSYLEHLENSNIHFLAFYGQKAQPSHDEYIDILKRSKIVLNFSESVNKHQIKGRAFEAIQCGALLFESSNSPIERFFIDGEDYVSFNSKEDLESKAKYFLTHEAERAAIAESGETKARTHYHAAAFWGNILDKFHQLNQINLSNQ